MTSKSFHPLLVIDEQYILGRAESVGVELTENKSRRSPTTSVKRSNANTLCRRSTRWQSA